MTPRENSSVRRNDLSARASFRAIDDRRPATGDRRPATGDRECPELPRPPESNRAKLYSAVGTDRRPRRLGGAPGRQTLEGGERYRLWSLK